MIETRNPEWTATDPAANRTLISYDADGDVTTRTDGNNNTTTYVYDAAGELIEEHRPDTTVRRTEYTPDGLIQRQLDGADAATEYLYDRRDNPIRTTYPNGDVITSDYNLAGNRVQHDGVTYTYDALNRLSAISYNDASTPNATNITYDASGNRTAMTDGTGIRTWEWDSLNRLTSTTDGAGATIAYSYDLAGRTISIDYPNAAGTVTRSYDDAGRLTSVTDWANRTTNFGYDPDSNLVSQDNANGTSTTIQPDRVGRTTDITHSNSAGTFAAFAYTRGGNGQLDNVASTGVPADDHAYGYDSLGQLTTVDSDTYSYDAADNLTTLADGTARSFNNANQLSTSGQTDPITFVGSSEAAGSKSISAGVPAGAAAGDLAIVGVTHPSSKNVDAPPGYTHIGDYIAGDATGDVGVLEVYQRTLDGTETTIDVTAKGNFDKTIVAAVYRNVNPTNPIETVAAGSKSPPGTSATVLSFDVDLTGEELVMLTGSHDNAGTWTPPTGMTERTQIATGATDSAIFDQPVTQAGPTGNIFAYHSTETHTIGVVLALRPMGTGFIYDNGNRIAKVEDTSTTSYTYDKAHRLINNNNTATYAYNGDGLRATTTTGGTTTRFTWDTNGTLPLLLSDGDNSYIYGPYGTPIATIDPAGNIEYHHHDQLGSIRASTDINGNPTETRTYDAYGDLTGTTGTPTTPFGYAGEYTDPESGLIYLRARNYDPTSAQFLTRDPFEALTREDYSYAANNPLNFTDPSGLYWGEGLVDGATEIGGDFVSGAAERLGATLSSIGVR